jgi:hypothetical protein
MLSNRPPALANPQERQWLKVVVSHPFAKGAKGWGTRRIADRGVPGVVLGRKGVSLCFPTSQGRDVGHLVRATFQNRGLGFRHCAAQAQVVGSSTKRSGGRRTLPPPNCLVPLFSLAKPRFSAPCRLAQRLLNFAGPLTLRRAQRDYCVSPEPGAGAGAGAGADCGASAGGWPPCGRWNCPPGPPRPRN